MVTLRAGWILPRAALLAVLLAAAVDPTWVVAALTDLV
jgi:hypothetical protein